MVADAEQLLRDYYAAWNSHDAERIASFYAEDGVHEDVAVGTYFQGRAEIAAGVAPLFAAFPDFQMELRSMLNAGDRLAHEWVMSGTLSGRLQGVALVIFGASVSGRRFTVRGASAAELVRGRIGRNTDYWNLGTMLEQLAAGPAHQADSRSGRTSV